jgi:hypothetical protein
MTTTVVFTVSIGKKKSSKNRVIINNEVNCREDGKV